MAKSDGGKLSRRNILKMPVEDPLTTWSARMMKHLELRGEQWVEGGKLRMRRDSIPISPNYPRAEASRAGLVPVRTH